MVCLMITSIMSKLLKTIFTSCYIILLLQYLKISLSPIINEVDLNYIVKTPQYLDAKEKQFKFYSKNFTSYVKSYKRPKRFSTDYKYILKYYSSTFLHYGTVMYKNGQKPFIESNCTYFNCYLTSNKGLLNDFRDFDAILFDVENSWDAPLVVRKPYQKYVFVGTESSEIFPLCDAYFDGYYNLTWSYKLDSDIPWTYIKIYDKNDNPVGPKINMNWIKSMEPTPEKMALKVNRKKKAVAWLVSHCKTKNGRMELAKEIEKELKKYNLTLDIYGWCGKKTCPNGRLGDCLGLLESTYFFYLSFESSMSEDYVTEKLLYPLQNYAVPVVFGGANYSRFLPPNSYIDANKLNASEVAAEIYKSMQNIMVYLDYFRWHNYYRYENNIKNPDICKLCEILNVEEHKRFAYESFRYWWNPRYDEICQQGVGRYLFANPEMKGHLDVFDLQGGKIF